MWAVTRSLEESSNGDLELEVVDTFFATELLDRLDPNVAIEITKRFLNAKFSGWHKVQAVGRIDRMIRSHPQGLCVWALIRQATPLGQ